MVIESLEKEKMSHLGPKTQTTGVEARGASMALNVILRGWPW